MFLTQDFLIYFMILSAVYFAFNIFTAQLVERQPNFGLSMLMSLAGGALFVYAFLNFYSYNPNISIGVMGASLVALASASQSTFNLGRAMAGSLKGTALKGNLDGQPSA